MRLRKNDFPYALLISAILLLPAAAGAMTKAEQQAIDNYMRVSQENSGMAGSLQRVLTEESKIIANANEAVTTWLPKMQGFDRDLTKSNFRIEQELQNLKPYSPYEDGEWTKILGDKMHDFCCKVQSFPGMFSGYMQTNNKGLMYQTLNHDDTGGGGGAPFGNGGGGRGGGKHRGGKHRGGGKGGGKHGGGKGGKGGKGSKGGNGGGLGDAE